MKTQKEFLNKTLNSMNNKYWNRLKYIISPLPSYYQLLKTKKLIKKNFFNKVLIYIGFYRIDKTIIVFKHSVSASERMRYNEAIKVFKDEHDIYKKFSDSFLGIPFGVNK